MKIIIIILLIIIAGLLAVILYYKKDKMIRKIKKEFIILPKHKDPNPDFIDENNILLNDIIESIDIEEWTAQVDVDISTYRRSYDITIVNPSNTLQVFGRIHTHAWGKLELNKEEIEDEFHKNIDVATFRVAVLKNGLFGSHVNYTKDYKNITIPLLWRYVVDHNNELNRIALKEHENKKNDISSKLVTLKRDRTLKKII